MIPFLHIGPLAIPTFGLMVATGLLVAAYVLQADFDRRRAQFVKSGYLKSDSEPSHHDEGFFIIRVGFAWFGGLLGGFVALAYLARRFEIPTLIFMDLCSPAAAVGYAIGRIGCLLSGDGDYGRPTSWPWPWGMAFPHGVVPTTETCVQWGWLADCRVYPTPIYEFFIWIAIAAFLWRMGKQAASGARPKGEIFCGYLILTGVARFLIEFIRINPRTFFGLSNAQTASLVSVVIGVILFWWIKRNSTLQSKSS